MLFDRIYLNRTGIVLPTKDVKYTVEFRFPSATKVINNQPKFITTFSESLVLQNNKNNMIIFRGNKQPYYEKDKQVLSPYRLIFLRLKGV